MDRTVARLNIEHFRKLLALEMDGVKRQTIVRLLAEEEEKLAALEGRPVVNHHRFPQTHNHLDEILEMAMAELGAGMGNIQLLGRDNQTLFISDKISLTISMRSLPVTTVPADSPCESKSE